MLTDRHHLHSAIIDIALEVGFSDVSHFNRTFRHRFGETPSGVRAASIMPEGSCSCTPPSTRATPPKRGHL
jgi:AraC-like DNA-binding protein